SLTPSTALVTSPGPSSSAAGRGAPPRRFCWFFGCGGRVHPPPRGSGALLRRTLGEDHRKPCAHPVDFDAGRLCVGFMGGTKRAGDFTLTESVFGTPRHGASYLYLRTIFVNNAQNPAIWICSDLQYHAVFRCICADQIARPQNIFQRRWQRPRG